MKSPYISQDDFALMIFPVHVLLAQELSTIFIVSSWKFGSGRPDEERTVCVGRQSSGLDSAMWLQRTEFSLDVSSLINESSRTLPSRIKQKTLLVVNLNSYSLLSRHLSSTSAPSPSFPFSSLFFKSSWPVSGAPGVISLSFLQCHSPQYMWHQFIRVVVLQCKC